MFVHLILLVLVFFKPSQGTNDNSVLEKLKSGLKLAGQLLGSDHAGNVANLVSEAFEKTHSNKNKNDSSNNIFSGFMRILGFDTKKIGAITVNAIIFVAQLISSSVTLKSHSQIPEAKSGNLFDWVVNNMATTDLLRDARDENLSEMIIEYVKERSLDEETGCIQLLICKSSPFIRKMQESLRNKENNTDVKGYKALFSFLPGIEEVADNGHRCENKYPYCSIPF